MVLSLSTLFGANLLLSLLDASIGYHLAPILVRIRLDEEGQPLVTVASLRRLLTAVVALFAFINCAAYYQGSSLVLAILAAAIVGDILIQFILAFRLGRR